MIGETIIDAELSSWTAFYDGTFEKYSPLCRMLTIVYLRGGKVTSPSADIRIIHIDEYFDALKAIGREDLINDIVKLREEVESLNN